jgi:hypothetical protein
VQLRRTLTTGTLIFVLDFNVIDSIAAAALGPLLCATAMRRA